MSQETPAALETRIATAVNTNIRGSYEQRQVFPYVQRYEFEGLLFSDVNAFAVLPIASEGSVQALYQIRSQFPTPEDVNDSPGSAPSKRIQQLIPRYRKRDHGYVIAKEIGLDKIRTECPRFGDWLSRVESLGGLTFHS